MSGSLAAGAHEEPGRIAKNDAREAGWEPVYWLLINASVAALLVAPIEVLLLFLLSPDRPLTLGDFAATLLALLPQILVMFVLLGPGLAFLGRALTVTRFTKCRIVARYVLRFLAFDVLVLAAVAVNEWRKLEELMREPARSAFALTTSALVIAAILLVGLIVRDSIRPIGSLVPWLVAVTLGMFIALGIAAELRRIYIEPPQPAPLFGFAPQRPLVLIEIPGMNREDLESAFARGEAEALRSLLETGVAAPVRGGKVADSVSLHASLVTGQGVRAHGLLTGERFRPRGDRRSFAILPRGLLLQPLLRTPLWTRIAVDERSLSALTWSGIAESLDVPLASVADPLSPAGEIRAGSRWIVSDEILTPGRRLETPWGVERCMSPRDAGAKFFEPVRRALGDRPEREAQLRDALAQDLCAVRLALRALERPGSVISIRFGGFDRVARQFAGYRRGESGDDSARGLRQTEIDAYEKVLRRYARGLDRALMPLIEGAWKQDAALLVVSTHEHRPDQSLRRLGAQLVGWDVPTAQIDEPPTGFVIASGTPFRHEEDWLERPVPLTSITSTALWSVGLPIADDIGAPFAGLLDPAFVAANPAIVVDSYAQRPAAPR